MEHYVLHDKIYHFTKMCLDEELWKVFANYDQNIFKNNENEKKAFYRKIKNMKNHKKKEHAHGYIQEHIGRNIIHAQNYISLISTSYKLNGYDGIFQKYEKVYIYESKYLETGTISELIYKSNKTIEKNVLPRVSELNNAKDNKNFSENKNEIKLLDEMIEAIESGKKPKLPHDRRIHGIGSKNIFNKEAIEKNDDLKKYEKVLIFNYEE